MTNPESLNVQVEQAHSKADVACARYRDDYAPEPSHRCPTCNSKHPHLHPAMAFEGEVEVCADNYHLIPTNQNRPAFMTEVRAKRREKGLDA